jgi:hypothetical protein
MTVAPMQCTADNFREGIESRMTKGYPALLAEWGKRRESTKRDKNIVAFREDCRVALG